MHEITFSTDDKPKLLSQEAHAFSTVDHYSLDVFVVDGWPYEETEQLRTALERELLKLERKSLLNQNSSSPSSELDQTRIPMQVNHLATPNDGMAIKILKTERVNNDMLKEIAKED
ncbi:hypothetical protein Tco_1491670 [Tanacetum coccineum]